MTDGKIQMVDLKGQYARIKAEVDSAIGRVIDSCAFINGPAVTEFAENLRRYTGAGFVIPCANGTDALQIALMALGLEKGDEVIVPSFTYVASAEVIAILGLRPVFADIDPETFNIDVRNLDSAVTSRTKAIIPVHLFGHPCDMAAVMEFAGRHSLYVVEDNAQSLGASCIFPDGTRKHTGTVGHFGCTSFFPSKNLGCYGDGGAMMTSDPELAEKARMIANHGQKTKYHHDIVGCNSRLDSIQAAILDVKLRYLNGYCEARRKAAAYYREGLEGTPGLVLPCEKEYGTHVYHQFTLRVADGKRDGLKDFLASEGIPSMVYYPLPLHRQKAYSSHADSIGERSLQYSEDAASTVLSLPMHTELTESVQDRITAAVRKYMED